MSTGADADPAGDSHSDRPSRTTGDATRVSDSLLFELMVGAFAFGFVAAVVLPLGAFMRWTASAGSALGSAAALALGVEVLRAGATWTGRFDNLLQPLGGVSLRLDSLGAFFLVIVGFTGVPASVYGVGYL